MSYHMHVAGTVLGPRAPTHEIVRDRLRIKAKKIRSYKRLSHCLTTASYAVRAWPKQLQKPRPDGRLGAGQIENKRKNGASGSVPNCLTVSNCLTVTEELGRVSLFEHSQGTGYVHLLKLSHGERRSKGDHRDACPKEAGHRRYVYREYDAHVGVAGGDQ